MVPSYMTDMFPYVKAQHSVNLRSARNDCLYLKKPKTEAMKKSLSYSGASIWNQLPQDVKNAKTLDAFKRKCTSYLISVR